MGRWSTPRYGRLYLGCDPVPIVYESLWAHRAILEGYEKSHSPPGFDPEIEYGSAVHNNVVTKLILEIFIAKSLVLMYERLTFRNLASHI